MEHIVDEVPCFGETEAEGRGTDRSKDGKGTVVFVIKLPGGATGADVSGLDVHQIANLELITWASLTTSLFDHALLGFDQRFLDLVVDRAHAIGVFFGRVVRIDNVGCGTFPRMPSMECEEWGRAGRGGLVVIVSELSEG